MHLFSLVLICSRNDAWHNPVSVCHYRGRVRDDRLMTMGVPLHLKKTAEIHGDKPDRDQDGHNQKQPD